MHSFDGAAAPLLDVRLGGSHQEVGCTPPETLALARAAHHRLADLAQRADEARGQVLEVFGAIEAHRHDGTPTTFEVATELDDMTDRLLDLMGRIHDACDPYAAWDAALPDVAPADEALVPEAVVVIEVGDEGLDEHFALVPSVTEAMIGMDRTERITAWNAAAERLFGWSEHEAVGQQISIIVPTSGMDEFRTRCRRVFDGRPEQFVTLRQHRDGTPLPVTVHPSAIFTSAGEIVGALATYLPARRDTDHA